MGGAVRPDLASGLTVDRRKVVTGLYVGVALLLVLHLVAQWLLFYGQDALGRDFEGAQFLDVDVEMSLPTWWQVLVLATAGGLAALLGHLLGRGRPTEARRWSILGLIFVLMSLDEATSLHERLIEPMRDTLGIDGGPLFFAWVVPAMAGLVLFAALYLRFWWDLPAGPRRRIGWAGVVFLLGALGAEMVSGAYLSESEVNLGYGLLNGLEEGLEMVGAVLLVDALLWMIQIQLQGRHLEVSVETGVPADH